MYWFCKENTHTENVFNYKSIILMYRVNSYNNLYFVWGPRALEIWQGINLINK